MRPELWYNYLIRLTFSMPSPATNCITVWVRNNTFLGGLDSLRLKHLLHAELLTLPLHPLQLEGACDWLKTQFWECLPPYRKKHTSSNEWMEIELKKRLLKWNEGLKPKQWKQWKKKSSHICISFSYTKWINTVRLGLSFGWLPFTGDSYQTLPIHLQYLISWL